MASVITKIDKSSPLHHRAHPGDRLVSINGKEIEDVLDYKYFCYDTRLTVELEDENGHRRLVKIKKPEGGELGLEFESYLMIHKHGMPPHGGLGIGLERLTAQLCGLDNVRYASLFPRDLHRMEP